MFEPPYLSDIPQLDGNLSDSEIPNLVPINSTVLDKPVTVRVLNGPASSVTSSGHPIRTESYSLNRSKQLKKLSNDTMLKDFTITINNNDENVNIQCNTATYTLVEVPSFQDIKMGDDFNAENIRIHCFKITGKINDTDSTVNAVIFFHLYNGYNTVGDVTVHLHHTRRKLQFQGSTIMSNKTKVQCGLLKML